MSQAIRPDCFVKPAVVPPWPPAGHAGKHVLGAGDSWDSLGKKYGRATSWDLIIYNFGTTNFREVNWCMAYFLGCTEVTPDRRSFRFTPGRTLYLPPAGWKPVAGVPKRQPSPDEEKAETARRTIIQVLTAVDHLWPFGFVFQGRMIHSGQLRRVAQLLWEGRIGVVYDRAQKEGQAEYDSGANTFRVKFTSAETRERQGLIVHEAVHAAMDVLHSGTVARWYSEAAAYIVQCVFLRRCASLEELQGGDRPRGNQNYVFRTAWEVARKVSKGEAITPLDECDLMIAMYRTPMYRTTVPAEYDGV